MNNADESLTTADLIARYGWSITMVPEDEEGPGFAYTIGLWQGFGHPELLMQGLPLEVMFGVLNIAGTRIKSGERLSVGLIDNELLEGAPCGYRAVPAEKHGEYMGAAIRHYGGDTFEALQVLWPDGELRLPDTDACDDDIRLVQELALG
jgi:hypothetical protein